MEQHLCPTPTRNHLAPVSTESGIKGIPSHMLGRGAAGLGRTPGEAHFQGQAVPPVPCCHGDGEHLSELPSAVPRVRCVSREFPVSLVAKDLALSLLWRGLNPWPGNFYTLQAWQKKKICKQLWL